MDTDEMTETNATNGNGTNNVPTAEPPEPGPPDAASESEPATPTATVVSRSEIKPIVDLDLVLANYADEFDSNPRQAADRLHDLLIDPVTCEARCRVLEEVRKRSANRKRQPAGALTEPRDYVRELMWLANHQLDAAIESGQASPKFLSQLAARPDLLRLASRAVVDGKEAIAELVKEHQVGTWKWLRDEVLNGNLQKHLGDGVVGKHVAVWKKDQPYTEMVVGDCPAAVRSVARERWMVPNGLVAETFVDAN